jgi:flagellar hook-length control protein FliK
VNVLIAAPAAAPHAPRTCTAAPAAGEDFAALLAGLGGAEPAAAPAPQGPVDAAATDQPPPQEADQQPGADAASLVAPMTVPLPIVAPVVAAPVVAAPALPTAAVAPTPSTADEAAVAEGTAPGAGTPDLRPAAPAAAPQAPVTQATPSALVAPVPSTSAATGPAPAEVTAAPSELPPTSAPDAVVLSVPADVAGDSPVPALDVRSPASPAAPVDGAQSAGTAVGEAVLPNEAAVPAVDVPNEVPRPEAAPAAPAAAAAPAGAGAEAGVAGPQPADLRAGAPTTPAAAPPPPATPPASQVAQLLTPVLSGPDGSYSLSLQLYPEELGAVQVEVLLRSGEIRLALHAPDEAAQAALRSALPDLRADLTAGGLTATSLSVDDGRPGTSSDRSPDRRPDGQGDAPGRRSHPYRDAEPGARQLPSHSDAALDLRM